MKQRKNSIKALRRRRQAEKRAEAARRVEEEQRRAALRVELEAERARSRAAAAARQRLATEPTVPAGDPPPRLEVRLGEEQPRPRSRPGSGMRLALALGMLGLGAGVLAQVGVPHALAGLLAGRVLDAVLLHLDGAAPQDLLVGARGLLRRPLVGELLQRLYTITDRGRAALNLRPGAQR